MPTSEWVRRAADVPAYAPANHTGTANQRIICRDTVGARRVEVLLGTIAPRHGALPHAHPPLEQASLLLSGQGLVELPGLSRTLQAGQWCFNAQGVFHRFEVTSDTPGQVMVVYAPPYGENPDAVVRATGMDDPRFHAGAGQVRDVPDTVETIALPHYRQAQVWPVVTPDTVGSRFLDIYTVQLDAEGGAAPHLLADAEQVLCVQHGAIRGEIDGQPFQAEAQSWVFVPEGRTLRLESAGAPARFVLIRAHDAR